MTPHTIADTEGYSATALLRETEPLTENCPTCETAQDWLLIQYTGLANSGEYHAGCSALIIDNTNNRTIHEWHGSAKQIADAIRDSNRSSAPRAK